MAHLPQPIARVRHALRTFLDRRRADGALDDGDLLLVACSGGADSLALASQLAFLAPRSGLRGGLVTVDHRMQAGSGAQARAVAQAGADFGLDPVLVRAAPERAASEGTGPGAPPAGLGPEGTARRVRYAALAQAAAETQARAILLGHTMEDQAETVLLGLLRGAGTRALAGMAPTRATYWRPLLGVRRADTEAACAALGLTPWHDPTNAPDGPWRILAGGPLPRAAIRHHVLPATARALDQDPVPALARTAELARVDSDYLDALARDHHHLIDTGPGGHLGAAVGDLTALPQALRWRVLRELLTRAGSAPRALTMAHVREVDGLLTDWRGQAWVEVPGGLRVRRACGRLDAVAPPPMEKP